MLRISLFLWLVTLSLAAPAATCTWNVATGNWSASSSWAGCADVPGPSTRSPGVGDIAVLVNGTANLDASPTVSEFELGTNGVLSVVGSTKTFDVTSALRFAGGQATTILGTNQLLLKLHAGGTGSLVASTSLKNATFFENSGTLTLGSASGVALTLVCCAEVRNMPGATITMTGGDSHLYFDGGGTLLNNAGATLTISGNTQFARPTATSSLSHVTNLGTMTVTGPGTLNMPIGVGIFQQFGDLTISNATLVCSSAAANPDKCSYGDSDATHTGSITRLANATLDLGGTGVNYPLGAGSTLTGQGMIKVDVTASGKLAPGALSGTPYATLAIGGKLTIQSSALIDLDLGGSGAGMHDAITVGGSVADFATTFAGRGRLNLRLAPGYNPALGEAVPVMTYPSFLAGSAFNRIDANYTLDYAARFDPTVLQVFPAPRVTIDNPSVVEGASGTTPMTFHVQLSQPSSQTVTVDIRYHDATAAEGLPPSGDYTYPGNSVLTFTPGQTQQTAVFTINGDTVVEGDESFSVELQRVNVVNAAFGNGVQGDLFGIGTILTDELPASTRYVLVGKEEGDSGKKIRRYTTAGTFIDTWDDRMPSLTMGYIVTGMCFAPSGQVLATRFAFQGPILFSHLGAMLDENFAGATVMPTHESCVFDLAGNVYIGLAGANGVPDSSVPVRKFDHYGNLLDTFVVPTGTRGTDWIDLAGDQCTLYYTSEDTSVRRYNVCTHAALPVFATGLTPPYCYALRLRPNRELMVACQDAVHRLSPQGINLKTYTRQSIGETDVNGLFAMNLDPDGTSFWTAGIRSGNVYHVDITSGALLGSFNSGMGGVSGLAVYDELHDDVIFADAFEMPPPLVPIIPGIAPLAADAECETQFWPEVRDMPPFIPTWMSVLVRDDGECDADN